jgi:hypothetical protein
MSGHVFRPAAAVGVDVLARSDAIQQVTIKRIFVNRRPVAATQPLAVGSKVNTILF